MPTYEYQCEKCGTVFEAFQSMSDPPLKRCQNPKCKGKVKRLVSAGSGLIFKGSGFYITDYKKKTGKIESSPAPVSESKAETKSETKKSEKKKD